MYGANVYGTVPYATFGSVVLFVAACIHIDNRLVYTATVDNTLVYTATVTASVPPFSGSAVVC